MVAKGYQMIRVVIDCALHRLKGRIRIRPVSNPAPPIQSSDVFRDCVNSDPTTAAADGEWAL